MKKLILAAVALVITFSVAQAQTNTSGVKVKVNVELNPFQSIEIGSGVVPGAAPAGYDDAVTLRYKTAADYKHGVDTLVQRQLKVSSVGSGYRVKAALSSGGKFIKELGNGQADYDASQLLEIAVGGKASQTAAANLDFGPFGQTSDAGSSVLDQELDVKYIGKPLNEDTVKKLLGNGGKDSKAVYTVDVVYTIAAN